MAIFKKETKEEKAVNELINKKEMLVKAVQKEITAINSQIIQEYQKIGQSVYSSYTKNNAGEADFNLYSENLSTIDELKNTIKEKENKLEEICNRYDDEIKILKESLGIALSECPSCSKKYRVSVDKFCMDCGQKL